MILLTDEEIMQLRRELKGGELNPIEYVAVFNKAQLKKVVELLLDNCDDCDHLRPVHHFRFDGDTWRVLLKEIE